MRQKKVAAVNVGKIKVISYSRHVNLGRIDERLNGKPLEEVDCFKYFGSQVAADGGFEMDVVHILNIGYKVSGALKSVINPELGINAKKCL